MGGSAIVTGVDRLMELVKEKKRISFEDAASEIGVSRAIIEEWADFLEEERIIELKHKFTHTEIVFRAMPKIHVKTGHRQVMNNLNIRTLEDVEKKIDLFKKEMYKHLELIKKNMKTYDHEKFKTLNNKISTFDDDLNKKVNDIKKELAIEKKQISTEQKEIVTLQKQKQIIQKRLSLIEQMVSKKKILSSNNSTKVISPVPNKKLSNQDRIIREKIRKLNQIKAKTIINKEHFEKKSFERQIETIESLLNDYMMKLKNAS
jgi:hypothetical protein